MIILALLLAILILWFAMIFLAIRRRRLHSDFLLYVKKHHLELYESDIRIAFGSRPGMIARWHEN